MNYTKPECVTTGYLRVLKSNSTESSTTVQISVVFLQAQCIYGTKSVADPGFSVGVRGPVRGAWTSDLGAFWCYGFLKEKIKELNWGSSWSQTRNL